MMNLLEILRMGQSELKVALATELAALGYNPIAADGFLYAEGSVPVLLVAHLDTFYFQEEGTLYEKNRDWQNPCQATNILVGEKVLCISPDGRFIMSPTGVGGDDRCGVFMILELIKEHKCHILFCEDEEIGCQGARKFGDSGIECAVNYIIGLDRRGDNDAVFYKCENPEFTEFIKGFGFECAKGTVSDISHVAPYLMRAAVNISCGYYCEHHLHEYIDTTVVHRNIARLQQLIATPTGVYEYMEKTQDPN